MRKWIVVLVTFLLFSAMVRAKDKEMPPEFKASEKAKPMLTFETESYLSVSAYRRALTQNLALYQAEMNNKLPGYMTVQRYTYFTSEAKPDDPFFMIDPPSIRIGATYFSHINSGAFLLGYNKNFGGGNGVVSFLGYLGNGLGPAPAIMDQNNIDIEFNSVLGVGVEYNYAFVPSFQAFAGLAVLFANPQPVHAMGSVPTQGIHAGLRFLPIQAGPVRAGVDIFGGMHAWVSSQNQLNIPPDRPTYWGGSILANIDFAGKSIYRTPIEISPLMSGNLGLLSGKITFPTKISDNYSLGLSGIVGTGITGDFNTYGAMGLELRRYTDEFNRFNPYIGAYYGIFDVKQTVSSGSGLATHLGGKIKIAERISADLYVGYNFWQNPWLTGQNGQPLQAPDAFDYGAGLTFQLKKAKPKDVRGIIKVIRKDELNAEFAALGLTEDQVLVSRHEPLDRSEPGDILRETRVYVAEKRDTVVVGHPCDEYIFGDFTDIKFFKVDLGVDMGIDKYSQIPYQNVPLEKDEGVFLIALFDSARTRVEQISDINMYLHFSDIENGRYFGYRWDRNRRMQPEYRDLAAKLDSPIVRNASDGEELFYGHYKDFVKRMRWLDDSSDVRILQHVKMQEKYLANMILEKMREGNPLPDKSHLTSDITAGPLYDLNLKNYKIAYVQYPNSILEVLEKYCPNYGVSIMLRKDTDADFDSTDFDGGHFRKTQDVALLDNVDAYADTSIEYASTDYDDIAFFSNTILGKHIPKSDPYPPILMCDFELGGFELSEGHKSTIRSKLNDVSGVVSKVRVIGYVDATQYPDNNDRRQLDLAWNRATAVRDYLQTMTRFQNVAFELNGVVTYPEAGVNDPDARCVLIEFE